MGTDSGGQCSGRHPTAEHRSLITGYWLGPAASTICALRLAASLAAALVGAGAVLGAAAQVPGSIGRAPVLAFLGLFALRVGLAAANRLSAFITDAVAVGVVDSVLGLLSRLPLPVLAENPASL